MVVTTVPSFRRKNSFQNISIDYFDSFYKTIYNETKKQRQDPSHPYTNLNLSVVAGSEYYERESSDASISNRLGQNIFHTIHSDKDVPQYGFWDGESSRFFHRTRVHKRDKQMVSHLEVSFTFS